MLKNIQIISLLIFIFLMPSYILANSEFTKEEIQYIHSKTFKLAMAKDYYPFSYRENNEIKGFSYDFLNLIKEKSNLKIEVTLDTWSNNLNKFKNKEINIIDEISYTKSRENFTNFSSPYYSIPNVIFSRKGQFSDYQGLISLKGKRVGITEGIYYYDKIKDLNLFELVVFKNSKNKMKALAYGKVDAIFNNLTSGQKYIKRGGYTNIKILDELESAFIPREDLRLGVTKDDLLLYSIIKKSMNKISKKERNYLINKWFIVGVQENKSTYLTPKEEDYLFKKEKVTMCINPSWMPFEKISKQKKHIGLSAEYFSLFQKHLHIPIVLKPTKSWAETIQYAKNRKCDILSLAMKTEERKSYLNFTTPYFSVPLVIATRPNITYIDNLSMLNNYKIGIVTEYAINETLRKKYPNINIINVENLEQGLKKVVNGELFGVVGASLSIGYQIQKNYIGELKITGKFDEKFDLGVAVRNDDEVLLSIFEKIVKSISDNEKQNILSKYIFIKYEEKIDYSLIWNILIIFSIVIVLFLYRQYILKSTNTKLNILVKQKTKDLEDLNISLEIKIKDEVEKNLQIQKKLYKSEKMASMGEMIGNIAHQWRQPLSVITTGATGLKVQKKYACLTDEVLDNTCDVINENAQYLSQTIEDFKNYIKGNGTYQVFDIETNMNTFLSLIKGTAKSNDIKIILDINLVKEIKGYANELIQCYINIFNNAKDAFIEKEIDEKYFFINVMRNGDYINIEFIDNAEGIDPFILSKIFEPYFTTKHQSQGTGLGLNMTYNLIVKAMKGLIEVENITYEYNGKSCIGSKFTISLPIKI